MLVFSVFCLSFMANAQDEMETMPYIQGEILVMIDDEANLEGVLQQFQYVAGANTGLALKETVSKPRNKTKKRERGVGIYMKNAIARKVHLPFNVIGENLKENI